MESVPGGWSRSAPRRMGNSVFGVVDTPFGAPLVYWRPRRSGCGSVGNLVYVPERGASMEILGWLWSLMWENVWWLIGMVAVWNWPWHL